ncbi:MAG: ChbG/HpnK family deacetylase [Desulfobacterota bacterium]|nr:ChbG/HpnK family deacetylase [Thermodesulfobacteriota bacterium]
MTAKRLIINADDLGADEGRNAGIFEAIQAGMVTSVSILPNGPGLRDAIERIRSSAFGRISWGIHLNLSEGRPVSTKPSPLLCPEGTFLGKPASQRLLMTQGDPLLEDEIGREIDAQITLLKTSGLSLSHIDGHQHIHVFPAVLKAMIRAALKHEIPWVRIPEEPISDFGEDPLSPSALEEARFFSQLGQAARPFILASGLHVPDHFYGLYLKNRPSLQRVESFLETLPDGLTEWMVHPGRRIKDPPQTPFSGFSTQDREEELKILLDGHLRLILKRKEIFLTPFPEILS